MPGYSYYLIVSLVAAGALIAYVGDYIGRNLGRRRATLLGLRPRQTARLVSVLAGVLISGVTIGISVEVSRDVRVGFFQAERLRSDNETLRQTQQLLESQVSSKRSELDSMSQQRDVAAQQVELAVVERNRVSSRLAEARQSLAASRKRLGSVEKELRTTHQRLEAVDQRLVAATKDLAGAESALAGAGEDLDRYEAQLKKALGQVEDLRRERESLEGEIENLTAERERLQREVVTLTPYVRGNLAFLVGEEITRQVVPHQLSLGEATSRLQALVGETERLAQEKGAKANSEGRTAVCVRERGGVSLADIIQEEAGAIVTSPQDMVVLITSAANCLEGQPLVFEFGLYRNYFLFTKGQPIATTMVDSSLDQAEMFQQLNRILDDAASRAFRHGVLRTERPPYTQELFNAVTEIKEMGGRPTVAVVAGDDIWTAGPLSLRLKVEGGGF